MVIYSEGGQSNNNPLEPSAIDKLNSRINATNNRVSAITPYTESKTAYIGDTCVEFNKAKDGVITTTVIDEDGMQIPCELQIVDNIKVIFDSLEKVATVTISIQ